jgi:hypothetical protein
MQAGRDLAQFIDRTVFSSQLHHIHRTFDHGLGDPVHLAGLDIAEIDDAVEAAFGKTPQGLIAAGSAAR